MNTEFKLKLSSITSTSQHSTTWRSDRNLEGKQAGVFLEKSARNVRVATSGLRRFFFSTVLSHWDISHAKFESLSRRRKPTSIESRYPSYGAYWVFQCFHNPQNSDMDYRIFNVRMCRSWYLNTQQPNQGIGTHAQWSGRGLTD